MEIYNNKKPQLQDLGHNIQKINKAESKELSNISKHFTPIDRVDISDKAKEISELTLAIHNMPDVRSDKIAEIKRAIETGTYVIDPKKIAESLLKEIL